MNVIWRDKEANGYRRCGSLAMRAESYADERVLGAIVQILQRGGTIRTEQRVDDQESLVTTFKTNGE